MDDLVKALLLGVNLRYRDDGMCKVGDMKRQKRLTQALQRLTIHADELEPDTLSSMVDSGEQIIEWLVEHPKATVTLSRWQIDIESSEFNDVDYERFDCPFDHSCAVEDFGKTGNPDNGDWSCGWSMG